MQTRIAPTPSGYLHAGNAVNFLIAWKLARSNGGDLLLRIDDLDAERMRPEFLQDVFDSLQWLGIDRYQGPCDAHDFRFEWSQRLRIERYRDLLHELREAGRLFACDCSRTQLATCRCRDRGLSFDGAGVSWRLRIDQPCTVAVKVWPSGTRELDLHALMPDPVLRKRNGDPAYQIASLADDVDFGMDLVVRGEDLLPSTACQLHLAGLLGLEGFLRARFLHHPLITDASGYKLSKSEGARALKRMREVGSDPGELHELADRLMPQRRP